MKYQVTVGDRRLMVEVDGDRVVVDGVEHHAELRALPGTPLRHLVVDGVAWAGTVESATRGCWALQDGGERVELEVLDERTAHIRSLIGNDVAPSGPPALKAPMPGLVLRVLVEPGQQVEAGTGLVVLEAMKMENELRAKGPGVVETVPVTPGQVVEKGVILLTYAS